MTIVKYMWSKINYKNENLKKNILKDIKYHWNWFDGNHLIRSEKKCVFIHSFKNNHKVETFKNNLSFIYSSVFKSSICIIKRPNLNDQRY